jgi:hypothetical protein
MHTRVILIARNKSDLFARYTTDFGVEWLPDTSMIADHPRVMEEIEKLRKDFDVVEVMTRDV